MVVTQPGGGFEDVGMFEVFKTDEIRHLGACDIGMLLEVCGGEFDREGETAQALDDAKGGFALVRAGEGTVSFQQVQCVGLGQLAQGYPVGGPAGRREAGGGKQVEFRAERGELTRLPRLDEGGIGDIVEDKQDVPHAGEALAQAAQHRGEMGVGLFALFVADVLCKKGGEIALG